MVSAKLRHGEVRLRLYADSFVKSGANAPDEVQFRCGLHPPLSRASLPYGLGGLRCTHRDQRTWHPVTTASVHPDAYARRVTATYCLGGCGIMLIGT